MLSNLNKGPVLTRPRALGGAWCQAPCALLPRTPSSPGVAIFIFLFRMRSLARERRQIFRNRGSWLHVTITKN